MATPLSADKLLKALRDEGLHVVEHRSWRTNNRNHKGPWGPTHGVMIHHTVTSGTSSSVELCYNGHSALPGPLCHGVIAKDGTVYLVGNGRANVNLGDGKDPWPAAQLLAIERASAAVCRAHGWSERCGRYTVGPGPAWSEADRKSYAAWQRKLGYTGGDADGIPGKTSWDRLKVPNV
ncbi:peptidoglycan-binding protein [Streptomyces griseus]|uniref:N-acetylmuramoyl-L-alanine amidase n=1 Tax=Streptomyces griseus TaxID=1911 RepID=UPI0004C4B795|nr:peptidoglycan-binding protein [Streptomyces griseus]